MICVRNRRLAADRMLDAAQLTGRSRTHVVDVEPFGCALHVDVIEPFRRLRAAAADAGIDLAPASAFRDFERQRLIWNAKYSGERPMLDRAGRPLQAAALEPQARIEAILWWSALPGASRHHWGTDFDVYDRNSLPAGASLRLEPDEYAPGGPFAALDAWLEQHAAEQGFYRPYRSHHDGVSPEPWHLSYAPIAVSCVAATTADVLAEALQSAAQAGTPVLGTTEILARLPELQRRFVATVDPPPLHIKD